MPTYNKNAEGSNTGVASITAAFSGSVTAADCIPAAILWNDPSITFTSCTQSAGTATSSSFVQVGTEYTTGNYHVMLGYFLILTTGTFTGKLTLSGTVSSTVSLFLHDVSGIDNTTVVDNYILTSIQSPGTGTNAVTTGNIPISFPNDYLFCYCVDTNNNDGLTVGTNYTSRISAGNQQTEDQVKATAGTAAGTWTAGGSGLDLFVITFGAFKAAPTPTGFAVSDNANSDNW
jgi:hypothetical protein